MANDERNDRQERNRCRCRYRVESPVGNVDITYDGPPIGLVAAGAVCVICAGIGAAGESDLLEQGLGSSLLADPKAHSFRSHTTAGYYIAAQFVAGGGGGGAAAAGAAGAAGGAAGGAAAPVFLVQGATTGTTAPLAMKTTALAGAKTGLAASAKAGVVTTIKAGATKAVAIKAAGTAAGLVTGAGVGICLVGVAWYFLGAARRDVDEEKEGDEKRGA